MGKQMIKRTIHGARHDPFYFGQLNNSVNSIDNVFYLKFLDCSDMDDEFENGLDPNLSRKILMVAQEQQEQIEKMRADEEENTPSKGNIYRFPPGLDINDDEFGEQEKYSLNEMELELDEEDAGVLSAFQPLAPKERQTLSDIVMEKINDMDILGAGEEETLSLSPWVNPKVFEAYSKLGQLLCRYQSGKLPKALKIIPSLSNWEEILYITKPETWSPQAIYEVTRMFVSSLKANRAQKFFSLVLLDRIREDIQSNARLNYHLYMALKKSLSMPVAFFRGILFPLCESGTCSLKEAAIIGSVLTKVTIPASPSSTALLRLAEMDYTAPNSLFIRVLLDKNRPLPFKVVEALVAHFSQFRDDPREMPVLWHQSMLVFTKRYTQDMIKEQKYMLLDVIKYKFHPDISSEIRHEIMLSFARDGIQADYDSDFQMED